MNRAGLPLVCSLCRNLPAPVYPICPRQNSKSLISPPPPPTQLAEGQHHGDVGRDRVGVGPKEHPPHRHVVSAVQPQFLQVWFNCHNFVVSNQFVEFYFYHSAYFGFGMVRLSTKFTRDMLPYWYRRMYDGDDAPATFT